MDSGSSLQAVAAPVAADGARPGLVPHAAPPARGLSGMFNRTLVPFLSRQVQTVGSTGAAGVALLVFAAAFFFGANAPLRTELGELQSTVDAGRAERAEAQAMSPAEVQGSLPAFIEHLPARSELPSITDQIVAQATAAGLTLERGTYDFTVMHSGRLVRARMAFPVHGRYPDIRRFIDATLAAVPGAGIDGLRFERKDVGSAEVDADIRFAIYVRAGT